MSSEIRTDLIKDKSNTKTLATLSSSAVTLHDDVVLPSGSISNYIGLTTAISSAQALSDTYTTVTGSLISSYIPTTGASKVYYSITLKISHSNNDSRGIASFIPFLDSSALANETGFSMDTNTGESSFDDYVNFYTLISASGWTSGKNVEIKARRYDHNYETQLHYNANFRHTDGSESVVYNKVNTVIYSIM